MLLNIFKMFILWHSSFKQIIEFINPYALAKTYHCAYFVMNLSYSRNNLNITRICLHTYHYTFCHKMETQKKKTNNFKSYKLETQE